MAPDGPPPPYASQDPSPHSSEPRRTFPRHGAGASFTRTTTSHYISATTERTRLYTPPGHNERTAFSAHSPQPSYQAAQPQVPPTQTKYSLPKPARYARLLVLLLLGGIFACIYFFVSIEAHSEAERELWKLERWRFEEDRKKWSRERQEYADWDRERRADEARRQPFYGEPVPAEHCHSWGRRGFTERLWNTEHLFGDDRRWACYNHPVNFNGRSITPEWCDDKGIVGGVIAHFYADVDGCRGDWGKFFDKGCVYQGSGTRRWESRLWNAPRGEDFIKLCMTSPQTVRGVFFEHPTFCEDRRGHHKGIVGAWDVADNSC